MTQGCLPDAAAAAVRPIDLWRRPAEDPSPTQPQYTCDAVRTTFERVSGVFDVAPGSASIKVVVEHVQLPEAEDAVQYLPSSLNHNSAAKENMWNVALESFRDDFAWLLTHRIRPAAERAYEAGPLFYVWIAWIADQRRNASMLFLQQGAPDEHQHRRIYYQHWTRRGAPLYGGPLRHRSG